MQHFTFTLSLVNKGERNKKNCYPLAQGGRFILNSRRELMQRRAVGCDVARGADLLNCDVKTLPN